jgi:hypothetical protein
MGEMLPGRSSSNRFFERRLTTSIHPASCFQTCNALSSTLKRRPKHSLGSVAIESAGNAVFSGFLSFGPPNHPKSRFSLLRPLQGDF